jgi:hypothetical protein
MASNSHPPVESIHTVIRAPENAKKTCVASRIIPQVYSGIPEKKDPPNLNNVTKCNRKIPNTLQGSEKRAKNYQIIWAASEFVSNYKSQSL